LGPDDVVSALTRLIGDYSRLVAKMPSYPHTAERMTREWIALFEGLLEQRGQLVAQRNLWRDPWVALLNQIM
jgi:hypothetical protein